MITIPQIREQIMVIRIDVENKSFFVSSLLAYSAVYFTIPELIAPLEKVNIMLKKLENAPTVAIPEGPIIDATTFTDIKPERILIKDIIPE